MRPGDFSPGNPEVDRIVLAPDPPPPAASMRPGDFSPGNTSCEYVSTNLPAKLQ